MASERNPMNSALGQALAFAGAVSLLGLIRDIGTWQEDIGLWVDVFRSFTRPVADFLFGWIAALFGWDFPNWLKDYLIVGIVSAGGMVRGNFARGDRDHITAAIIGATLWPAAVVISLISLIWKSKSSIRGRKFAAAFASTFIYFAILLAINYGLIYSGSPVAP